ncbi:MAG TPA: hypothetical protein DEF59_04090 [Candidatus Magasanikbacteria bacterium]|nr:hypothetical protein [Candidatus Magasanikbacteria bacterium]
MHAIQIVLFLLIAFVVLRIAARFRAKDMGVFVFLSWLVFWSLAAIVVWRPELSTEIAQVFGVGRGADFVTYIALIALFYGFFRLGVRLERQERNISKLTQALALREGEEDHKH